MAVLAVQDGEYIMKLIDKDALSMELTNEVLDAYAKADFRFAHALNVFQGLIDKAPTVEERKYGHWVRHNDIIACSECIWDMYWEEGNTKLNYCPNCGARMDGEEK